MAAAAPRDTVQIGPGEYAETVVLSDGVNLVAREPGSVTLVAPPASHRVGRARRRRRPG